ncbi:MAG: hypothetical protein PVH05_11715 [Burkholderiales bacterium]|jgi:hypothetical protein
MKQMRILWLFLSLSTLGCSPHNSDIVSISVPVTAECADWSVQHIKQISGGKKAIDVSFIPFDYTLPSHPDVRGYLLISSRMLKKKSELEGYYNSVLLGCHATSSMDLDVSELSKVVPLVDSRIKYIKVDGTRAHMVFFGNQSNKSSKPAQ